jgi:hypothetical protein
VRQVLAISGVFVDNVAVEVIGGIIVVVLVAAGIALWRRRGKPREWAAAGLDAVDAYGKRLDHAKRRELLGWVRQRAEVLQIEVPETVTGNNPAVITFHPTGRKYYLYPDFQSYKSAGDAGRLVDASNAGWGTGPVVSRWSEEELRVWLRKRRDELPPG